MAPHPADEYYDLGTYSRPVSTPVADAQRWFDRGLAWTYGFNHEAAVDCFNRALAVDPGCAMAYWGLAYALGPNYNKPWEFFDPVDLRDTVAAISTAVAKAQELAPDSSAQAERALIGALAHRYPVDPPSAGDNTAWSIWNQDYADAMAEVYQAFPDDLDVATLYADALMNLTPWALWDLRTGEPAPGSQAAAARVVLDRALATEQGRTHPGLLHMYIHLMEMSTTPEQALVAADRLRGRCPDAGHLQHMPTHLDVLCGDYRRVVSSNSDAIAADERFLARDGAMNFYTLYRSHNYHFKIYGAMFLGQSEIALETARRLEESIPEELLRVAVPPMADWLEGFLAMRVHVLIRFGRWAQIIELPLPQDAELYCATTAMLHYAKGVAYAATGCIEESEGQRRAFAAACARVPESRTLFNNTCVDILGVAAEMLNGELEYRKANYDKAFEHLRRAVELDDTLPYDEPWGWMQPVRHAYGALLLEQGHVEAAEAVYRADLGLDDTLPRALQHPGNVWALHGLHECLTTLGKSAEAKIIEQQLRTAVALADVPITASCLCRTSRCCS